MGAAIIVIVVVVLIVLVFVAGYNGLVRLRNRIDNAWSQIGVQLERRHDLIPNLIETVKGYAAHEKSTFEAVVAARNSAIGSPAAVSSSAPVASARARSAACAGASPAAKWRCIAATRSRSASE